MPRAEGQGVMGDWKPWLRFCSKDGVRGLASQSTACGPGLCQAHCSASLIKTLQHQSAVGIISPIFQTRKLQLRDVEQHAKGYTAKKWWSPTWTQVSWTCFLRLLPQPMTPDKYLRKGIDEKKEAMEESLSSHRSLI